MQRGATELNGHKRRFRALTALALCCAAVVLFVVGELDNSGEPGGTHQPPDSAARAATEAEEVKEGYEQAIERRRWRRSDEAERQRVRSRTAYRDAKRGEVASLVREEYPSIVSPDDAIVDPADVKRYTGEHTAIVDHDADGKPGGGTSLAVSSLPLRTASGSGGKEPLDLSLERDRSGDLEPVNPLVPISLPGDLPDEIQLGRGMSISVDGAPSVAPSEIGSSTALYPDVAPDTDLLASPIPYGVELFWLLRSPASPRSQDLRLGIPDGAELREASAAGGAIGLEVQLDGRRLLSVAPPTAVDAQGANVPVTMAVTGEETLRLTIAEGNWAYPILVDPAVDTYSWTDYASDFSGWFPLNTGGYSLNSDCMYGRGCFGHGLHIYAWEGQWYPAGSYAGFGYRIPGYEGDSTFISRLQLGWVGYWTSEGVSGPFMTAQLWDRKYGQNAAYSIFDSWWPGGIDISRLGDSPLVKEAQVLLTNPWAPRYARGEHHGHVGTATIYIDDTDVPRFGLPGRPPWVDNQPAAFPLSVSDAGLGILSITVTKPGGPSWQTSLGCNGGNRNPCPRTWESPANGTVNYDPSVLPQGVNNLNLTARDATGKVSQDVATTQVRVDHTDPTLDLSGSLVDAIESQGAGQ